MDVTGFFRDMGLAGVLALAVPQAGGADAPRSMCELMPASDVVALAPFTLPFVRLEGWPLKTSPAGCRYVFESPDGERAGIAIGVTDLGSTTAAGTHMERTAQDHRDLWQIEPERVTGIGDRAWFGGEDETGLKFMTGSRVTDVNLRGQFPEVSAQAKRAASIKLAQLLLTRMNTLKLK